MGAVYEADDCVDGGRVALKLLRAEHGRDSEFHRRFRREASILETLRHPAIVRVVRTGSDERGQAFIAMELLSGRTMRQRLDRDGRLSPSALVPIVEGICAGLEAAHAHGVLHGDLAPTNVFLVDDPSERTFVKLVDFGLSKIYGLERLTRTGEVIGTPHYMAPELLTGQGTIDGRIDIYSLGVILYEALTGRRPFDERNPGKLVYSIVTTKPARPADVAKGLSDSLSAVIERAMASDAEARFGTPSTLAEAFLAAAPG
jgi:serine/threonine-protein kinase